MDVLFVFSCRILLSVLFLIAGASKTIGGFANSRKALGEFGLPTFLVKPFSIALPVVELIVACLLLPSGTAFVGVVAALTLFLLFNAAIATNLALGKHPSCNCFGQLHSEPIGWKTFTRNSLLAGIAGALAWNPYVHPGQSIWPVLRGLSNIQITLLLIAVVGLAAFALQGFLLLHLFRQNGRLLLRIEALEARPAVGNQPNAFHPPAFVGLPIGSKAIPFDLPTVKTSRSTLDSLLSGGKPVLLISTDPNCGPCNALMPEVVAWQQNLASEVTIALLSHGRFTDNQKKAAEFGLKNVMVDKNHKIAEKYHAVGTPTGVLIRSPRNLPRVAGIKGRAGEGGSPAPIFTKLGAKRNSFLLFSGATGISPFISPLVIIPAPYASTAARIDSSSTDTFVL